MKSTPQRPGKARLTTALAPITLGLMRPDGVYLYGFVIADLLREFAHPGHEEIGAARPVELGSLTAIVSVVPPGEIEAGLSREPPDPKWIVPRAMHHESVLEAVLARGPVLPVRFGCVFGSLQALEAAVENYHDLIAQFLDDMKDRQEWTIKAFLDQDTAVDALLERDAALSQRYRRLPAAPGARYFLEKKLREEARTRALQLAKAAAGQIHDSIKQTGVEVKQMTCRASESPGRLLVLKLALLIPGPRLHDVLDLAGRAGAAGLPLLVEHSGPWPPYNFCPCLGEPQE